MRGLSNLDDTMTTHASSKSTVHALLLAGATLSLALLLAEPRTTAAQTAPDAATIASWVQTFYDQTQSMSARFVQQYTNRVYQRTDTSRGRVRFRKPGMMRFDYDEPNGKVIVSDGRQLTVFEPADESGGRGQYYQQAIGDSQLPAALSFLTGTGRLDTDFRFRRLDAARLGYRDGQVLELRPRRPSPHYSRVVLFVDDHAERRGVVHRVIIIDQANNRNRFDFEQQQLNRSVEDSVFSWRPPANARRVQP
ncbi:MAG: outer membrane lipoprotein carrier protein LolA [Sandaracinaceae bacterium]